MAAVKDDVLEKYFIEKEESELVIFTQSIGGHFNFLVFTESTLAKPLRLREWFFYENVSHDVQPFIPRYHGRISVTMELSQNGDMKYTANKTQSEIVVEALYKWDIIKLPNWVRRDFSPQQELLHMNGLSNGDIRKPPNIFSHEYIVIENLLAKFHKANILDLKLGFQHYLETMNAEKIQDHIAKCNTTTTSTLGVRLCGIALYNKESGDYNIEGKHFGKALKEDGLRDQIYHFLSSGHKNTVKRKVEGFVKILQDLLIVLKAQDTLRLFAVSILLLCEGDENSDFQIDARMIDFAKVSHKQCQDPIPYEGCDQGWIYGLNSAIGILKSFYQ